jgi:hypothetical protein
MVVPDASKVEKRALDGIELAVCASVDFTFLLRALEMKAAGAGEAVAVEFGARKRLVVHSETVTNVLLIDLTSRGLQPANVLTKIVFGKRTPIFCIGLLNSAKERYNALDIVSSLPRNQAYISAFYNNDDNHCMHQSSSSWYSCSPSTRSASVVMLRLIQARIPPVNWVVVSRFDDTYLEC